MDNNSLIRSIAGVVTLGVIVRPVGVPEYVWAVLGAAAFVALGLLPWRDASPPPARARMSTGSSAA